MDTSTSYQNPSNELPYNSGLRSTTIGTVVVRGGPIQMVIALLQSVDNIYIKVVEIEPKITTLGENIEEAVTLQKQHDELMNQLQNMPTPMEDFVRKADKLLANKHMSTEIVDAMGHTLNIVWEDILKLVHDRKHLLDLCANFHEKMGSCRGKMSSLEVACKDTMIPIEVDAVQDFLNKFKHLRIDVLTTIMAALKEGNELLAQLQNLSSEILDSRPDHIKRDALRAVTQVQHWLENLHDRRNMLEAAWQTRKTQLEQCLALAILAKDLDELEEIIMKRRNDLLGAFNLGECENTAAESQKEYTNLKNDALLLRDRALKITRATEKLVSSGCFAGDESCTRAYNILSLCTEYLELIDQREHWLNQSKEFFIKASKTLMTLEKLEIELTQVKLPTNSSESFAMYDKVLRDVKAFTEEPLRSGYSLLDEIGRTQPETQGVKRVLDEIENRKIYIEGMCSNSNEEKERVQQTLTKFLEQYNDILSWLIQIAETFIQTNNTIGTTIQQAKQFLFLHHKLMADLENKGEKINSLLEDMKRYLESLEPQQRYDVDTKAEDLHKHWIELKEIVLKRVDLVTEYIEFLKNAQKLDERFYQLNNELNDKAEESKLNYLEMEWSGITAAYGELKSSGVKIMNTKVADPYLETKSVYSNIEEILKNFSNRQFDLTTNWEKYTTSVFEKREIEIILEKIMNDHIEINNKTTKLDTQLYPIFTPPTEDPIQLKSSTIDKLQNVLKDINTAQNEIEERIQTTLKIQTNDTEYLHKINQVLDNLRSLKDKLDNIKHSYKMLLENLLNFLENIINLKLQIDEYFNKTDNNNDGIIVNGIGGSVDIMERNLLAEHEKYRENIMDKFRTLISQSELIIERVRVLEPLGPKEHDTDRILKLLENLRIHFESNNSIKMNALEKLQNFNKYKIDLNEINNNLQNVCKQLNEIKTQNVENLANSKTTSLAFEYFERTIELLEKRIGNFTTSSESLYTTNPEYEQIIRNDLDQLRRKWEQFKDQMKFTRNSLNLSNEYYELIDEIDCEYREITYFFSSVTNKIPFLREPVEAENLCNDIETYINDREGSLKHKLQRASQLSRQIYNEDRTNKWQIDINILFQSFGNLKSDIRLVGERLKNEEKLKEKEETQKLLQQQQIELQKQQQIQLQQQIEKQQLLLKQQQDEIDRVNSIKMISTTTISANKPSPVDKISSNQQEQNISSTKSSSTSTSNIEILKSLQINDTNKFNDIKYHAPQFIRPLCDARIGEGNKFIFECQVIGYPQPEIEWFKDGISIQNNLDYKTQYLPNGICLLQIDETLQADSAKFLCRASNLVGRADSLATLNVRESAAEAKMTPPQILKYLESGIAREGSSYQFNCIVNGNPLPIVQWYKNDKCIDDSPDYTISYNNGEAILKLDEVFLEDNAIYTVNVSNPAGFAQCSANLIVEPLEPTELPRFIVPLSNVMARVGQKIRLDCTVTGIPKPEIYWIHNGKPYNGRHVQYDDGSVTLVIPAAYPKDTGVYICTAKNLAGESYSSCNVSVKGRLPNETSDSEMASDLELIKPSVQLPLKNISIFEGKSVRLDCVIVGQPEPEVIWYHNERPVKESPDVQLLFQGDRCSLVIQEAFTEDAGTYKVVAINSAGEISSSCTLTVTPLNIAEPATRQQNISQQQIPELAPKFEKFLSDVLADEGDTIEMECTVTGEQPLSAKWYLSNKELIENDRFKIFADSPNGIFKLIVQNVSSDDRGVYTVKVSNNYGDAKCFSNLIVKSVNVVDSNHIQSQQIESKNICPTFKELFSDKYARLGDVVKFECIVIGKPTPKIKWFINNQPVHGKYFLVSTSGNRQVLTITEATPETIGKISCIAENDIGKATCLATLNLITDGVDFPSSVAVQSQSQEHNTESSRVTIKKSTFTTTSTSQVNSYEGNIPQSEIHAASTHYDQSLKQFGEQKPEIIESHHYKEFHKTADMPGSVHEKSTIQIQRSDDQSLLNKLLLSNILPTQKTSTRKTIAPKFTTPLVGKIVDQGANVMLEAIYDGFPSPEIKIMKNGEEIFANDKIKITNNFHKINVDLLNVNVKDAGRYSIIASNPIGQSTSTADVVIKKTIFPPVFGHRLQAQVAKRGERIIMEVEVSGTPDPTVTWYKDGKPVREVLPSSSYRLKSEGNTHTLIMDHADTSLSGKFMVKATNAGGEAQSIADFAVLEPTPERMIEVVKTTVYNNTDNLKNMTFEPEPLSFQTTKTAQTTEEDLHSTSDTKIITEHRCTTEATMRLEHKPTFFDLPPLTNKTDLDHKTVSTNTDSQKLQTDATQTTPQVLIPSEAENQSTIESTSITKKSSYDFFNKIQSESQPSNIPISIQQHSFPKKLPIVQHIDIHKKVDDMQKYVQSLPKLVNMPPEPTVMSDADMIKFNLTPGSPPEMGYIPKLSEEQPQKIYDTIKKLEESQIRTTTESPSTGISIFPQFCEKKEMIKSFDIIEESKFESSYGPIFRQQAKLQTPLQTFDRAQSPKPSAEGVAMEKLWTPKPVDYESGFSDYEETRLQTYTSCSENEPESLPIDPPKSIKETKKKFEEKIQEQEKPMKSYLDLKAPSLVKLSMPITIEPPKPSKSFLDDIHLEPGTPPEICFAPKPDRKQSLVEAMEQTLELDLLRGPTKVLPHSVPTFTPQLPLKDYHAVAPAVPIKPCIKPPPPVVPPKFIKADVYESDYESDRWKQSGSESDEPGFKQIKPLQMTTQRPKSIAETVPTKPSVFGPKVSGYAADTEESVFKKFESHSSSSVHESRQIFESQYFSSNKEDQHFEKQKFISPPLIENKGQNQKIIKNISINAKDYKFREEPVLEPMPFKPDSPKLKPVKVPPPPSPSKFIKGEFRESDYSSDHEERIHTVWNESDSEIKGYRPVRPVLTPTTCGRRSTLSDDTKSPAPPMEFDKVPTFDGPPRPKFEPIKHEQPVTIVLTTPEPVYKPKPVAQKLIEKPLHKPKPVSAKFIEATQKQYQQQQTKTILPNTGSRQFTTQYYTAIAGEPVHLASMATETRNTMQMKESSETCRRIVNMEQTKRVIHFDQQKSNQETNTLEPFPFSPTPGNRISPAQQRIPPPPTPTKFIPGEFRETDYDSEIENARIVPLWNTNSEPMYRHVEPPRPGRSVSLPRTYEGVLSPMQFDRGPEMPSKIIIENQRQKTINSNTSSYQTQTLNRFPSSTHKKYQEQPQVIRNTRDDMNLEVGSPPKYGYINEQARTQAHEIGSTFRQKSSKFINDISEDFKKTTTEHTFRPGFKRAPSEGDNKPHAYRNESRVSQYGTKCVDPNTGLIYFKYDFGYEFGILFPGEGKKFIGGSSQITDNTIKPTNQLNNNLPSICQYPKITKPTGDIIIPVQHLRTNSTKQKRFMNRNSTYTSDGEYSEPEFSDGPTGIKNKRYSLPLELNIDQFHKINNSNTMMANGHRSVSDLPSSVPINSQTNREGRPKRPPIFITPLKDIAVVLGQTARFECIVQSEPHPEITWFKNGSPIENNNKYYIEFRNGVCRLTIPEAYTDDAGKYTCTGINELGSVSTSADLLVPGNTRGIRF